MGGLTHFKMFSRTITTVLNACGPLSHRAFEGHMKKMVKEALEKKVVWPWIDRGDEDADKRKSVLKSCGYTEWKNPENGEWKLRYALPQADTSGQSDSDSDDTSSTTDKEGEDED